MTWELGPKGKHDKQGYDCEPSAAKSYSNLRMSQIYRSHTSSICHFLGRSVVVIDVSHSHNEVMT